jgi:hypothetical protein
MSCAFLRRHDRDISASRADLEPRMPYQDMAVNRPYGAVLSVPTRELTAMCLKSSSPHVYRQS